jgi:hypothetical protein
MAAAEVLEAKGASEVVFDVAERGEQIVPCPVVSRGRPVYSSGGAVSKMVSGRSGPSSAASGATQGEAPWMAVHAGVGPAKLLVSWGVDTAGRRPEPGRLPSAYVIETSASSTDGRDGEWRRELSVDRNAASARAHVIEYDGQSWVRLTFSGEPGGAVLPIDRLDLHDASDGTDDCWLVLGDARLVGLERAPLSADSGEGGWAALIHERYPGYYPALIDEARVAQSPAQMLERLPDLLALHSAARRVAIACGGASSQTIEADAAALEAMVATVLQSGRLPVVARQPAAGARDAADALNRCIDGLERRHGLLPGPDLAAWFDAHPDDLEGEPSVEGRRAIAKLWADAVDAWYVPH